METKIETDRFVWAFDLEQETSTCAMGCARDTFPSKRRGVTENDTVCGEKRIYLMLRLIF